VDKYGRAMQATDDSIIWCRKDAISLNNTLVIFLILFAFPRQQW